MYSSMTIYPILFGMRCALMNRMAITNGSRTVLLTISAPLVARMLDTATGETVELPLSAALECLDRLIASGYTVAG